MTVDGPRPPSGMGDPAPRFTPTAPVEDVVQAGVRLRPRRGGDPAPGVGRTDPVYVEMLTLASKLAQAEEALEQAVRDLEESEDELYRAQNQVGELERALQEKPESALGAMTAAIRSLSFAVETDGMVRFSLEGFTDRQDVTAALADIYRSGRPVRLFLSFLPQAP